MEDRTQAPEGSDRLAEAPRDGDPPPEGPGPLVSETVRTGLLGWLFVVLAGGGGAILLGQSEAALALAMAGLFALTQASDAAVASPGYRTWVRGNLPRGSLHGGLFRMVVRMIVPSFAAALYLGLAVFASNADLAGWRRTLAIGWSGGAAVLMMLSGWRPFGDALAAALFRTSAPTRTLRLAARLVLAGLLLPVPCRLVIDDLMRVVQEAGTLVDAPKLAGNLVGMVVLAFAAVGFKVRRNLPETLERLGISRLRPGHLLVAGFGLAAAIGLNSGLEWVEQRFFPALYAADRDVSEMIAGSLTVPVALLLGLSAGVGEEITVRGALQPRLGLVLASALFAALHVQYSWFGMATIGLLGVLLGLVRMRANTTTAMIVHALYDVVAVLAPRA